jgi:ParB family transcriptional regulator, chromosome partitioning protein
VSPAKQPPKLPGRTQAARRSARSTTGAFGELAETGRLRTVALSAIQPNRHQPRRTFDPDALQLLADSIAARGVLQPPVVRPQGDGYELVAGERRCRAAHLAGLEHIEVLISDQNDDASSLQDALMENVAREDLSPIEAARAYATIIDDLGLTREDLGRRIGQSRGTISHHLRLLDLPDEALELIDRRELTFAHGKALLLTDDHDTRRDLARRAHAEQWSTRKLEDEARAAGAPRARRAAPAADAEAFALRATEALSHATGLDVRAHVTASGTITLTLADQDAVTVLAVKLGIPAESLDEPAVPAAQPRSQRAG